MRDSFTKENFVLRHTVAKSRSPSSFRTRTGGVRKNEAQVPALRPLLPLGCQQLAIICYPCHHRCPRGRRSSGGVWRSPRDDSWTVGAGVTSKAGKHQKQMEGPRRAGSSPFCTPRRAHSTLAENRGPARWMQRTDGQSAKGPLGRANSRQPSGA